MPLMPAVPSKLQSMLSAAKDKAVEIWKKPWKEFWPIRLPCLQWKTLRKGSNESGLNKLRVRINWGTWSIATSASLLAVVSIIAAISLGAQEFLFEIYSKVIFGSEVPIDIQLAAVGVINKILDLMISASLENTAGVLVTVWMTTGSLFGGRTESGARLADLEFKDELLKPWRAIGAFSSRWSAYGRKRAGWVRLLTCLTLSSCLVFQGLAVNTVAIPKLRWFPNDEDLAKQAIEYPLPQFQEALDWGVDLESSRSIVGSDDILWGGKDGLVTASTLSAYTLLREGFTNPQRGWQTIGTNVSQWAVVDNRYNGSSCRGFAGQGDQALMIYENLTLSGIHPQAKGASGIIAFLGLVWPSSLVSCERGMNDFPASPISVQVGNSQDITTYASRSFSIDLKPFDGFSGARCNISFSRILFTTLVIRDDTNPIWIGVIDKLWAPYQAAEYVQQFDILPPEDLDAYQTRNLANQFSEVTDRLEGFLARNVSTAQFFVSAARELRKYQPEYTDDIDSLAPILCFMATHLMSIARWNVTLSDKMTNGLAQFHVIGSGPRLPWEWVAVAILVVLLLACIFGLFLGLVLQLSPGECLKAAGMLVAANHSSKLDVLDSALQNTKREVAEVSIYINAEPGEQKSPSIGLVHLADKPARGARLKLQHLRKEYKWF